VQAERKARGTENNNGPDKGQQVSCPLDMPKNWCIELLVAHAEVRNFGRWRCAAGKQNGL